MNTSTKKATLIAICDVSGSMGSTKKSMAKEYLGFVKATLETRYGQIDEKFVSHTTKAKEVASKEELFGECETGGTYISTGLRKAIQLANQVNRNQSDVFVLQFSDGDNWGEDNDETVSCMKQLDNIADFTSFLEIKTSNYFSTIGTKLMQEIKSETFHFEKISSREEVLSVFSKTRDFLRTLETKGDKMRQKDMERKDKHTEIAKIERFHSVTKVTLEDGTIGESSCRDGIWDEERGFKVAYLRALKKSAQRQLNKILPKTEIFIRVVDSGLVYTNYYELAKNYLKNGLTFEKGYAPKNGEQLKFICETTHPNNEKVKIFVCKDSENRAILIGAEGAKKYYFHSER